PNQRVRYPGRVIAINNHSMRSPDLTPQKAPGHVRILMLGDSTLMGTYVSNHELYSTLLEKKLNTAAGAPIFEVLNMGVNAWGPLFRPAPLRGRRGGDQPGSAWPRSLCPISGVSPQSRRRGPL